MFIDRAADGRTSRNYSVKDPTRAWVPSKVGIFSDASQLAERCRSRPLEGAARAKAQLSRYTFAPWPQPLVRAIVAAPSWIVSKPTWMMQSVAALSVSPFAIATRCALQSELA